MGCSNLKNLMRLDGDWRPIVIQKMLVQPKGNGKAAPTTCLRERAGD